MNAEIINAAPMINSLGINDVPLPTPPAGPVALPQHYPVYYLTTSKGKPGRTIFDPNNGSIIRQFGPEAFTVGSKFHKQASVFAQNAAANGNKFIVHRIVAPDAKDKANFMLGLEVLKEKLPEYARNLDGSYKLDESGEPEVVPGVEIDGYSVNWVFKNTSVPVGEYEPRTATITQGTRESADGERSQIFPIFEGWMESAGEPGNEMTFSFSARSRTDAEPFPSHFLSDMGTYPYEVAFKTITKGRYAETNEVRNIFGGISSLVNLDPTARNPLTNGLNDIEMIVHRNYIESGLNGFGGLYVYQDNLKTVSQMFLDAEVAAPTNTAADPELFEADASPFLINIASFTNSTRAPYKAIQLVDTTESVRLTQNSVVPYGGSSDGSVDDMDAYHAAIRADLKNYSDPMHEYTCLVSHPESVIYDTGFDLETKLALPEFISIRKDTFTHLTTFIDGKYLSMDEQFSLLQSLKSRVELYPESVVFGTGACRAMVTGGSGLLVASDYANRISTVYDVHDKSANYMGAGDGKWKAGQMFDRGEKNIIKTLKDVDISFVPASTRNIYWTYGLNYPLKNNEREHFFPAMKTVYDNDQSVLTSYFVVMACCYLNKISHNIWRRFTGSTQLTRAEFIREVNDAFTDEAQGCFDDTIRVVPNCTITEYDEQRGYSWTMPVDVYGNGMMTVMTAYLITQRETEQ